MIHMDVKITTLISIIFPNMLLADTVEKNLSSVVEEINNISPMQIDQDIRLLGAELQGRVLVHYYQLPYRNLLKLIWIDFKKKLSPRQLSVACSQPDIINYLFENNVSIEYRYISRDKQLIGKINIDDRSC